MTARYVPTLPAGSGVSAEQINALLPSANDGDPGALAELRAIFDRTPRLWEAVGDAAAVAEAELVGIATRDDPLMAEAYERRLRSLREELAGPEPSPLEALLVARIAACWLFLNLAEYEYYRRLGGGGLTWQQDHDHQRRIDRAQKRYLGAIKALAAVRKLELPALQLNIADKQINVAGGR